jgi:hypothetical protein
MWVTTGDVVILVGASNLWHRICGAGCRCTGTGASATTTPTGSTTSARVADAYGAPIHQSPARSGKRATELEYEHGSARPGREASDADVRNMLDDLGSPAEIVAAGAAENEAGSPLPRTERITAARAPTVSPWGVLEILAVLGLTVGTLVVPVVGALAGLILACSSARWTRTEKIVATVLVFLPVVALALGAAVFTASGRLTRPDPRLTHPATHPGRSLMNMGPFELIAMLLLAVALLGPVLAGAFLAIRLNRRRRESS